MKEVTTNIWYGLHKGLPQKAGSFFVGSMMGIIAIPFIADILEFRTAF